MLKKVLILFNRQVPCLGFELPALKQFHQSARLSPIAER